MRYFSLTEIFKAALKAADPYNAVNKKLFLIGDMFTAGGTSLDLRRFRRIIVAGAGKGTAPMAQAVEDLLGDRISEGVIIVKYGHTRPLARIRQIEASHPLPDEAGVKGTDEIIRLLSGNDERTLVIFLLSGGGSSLLISPVDGITLDEKRKATDALLRCGANINELNAVRKHLSKVKGGNLARTAHPATVLTMILSDVIGDRLDVIASGPTAPDSSTFGDALEIIRKYGIEASIPATVLRHLKEGAEGKKTETPKGEEPFFKGTSNLIVGSLDVAVDAAREKAEGLGYVTQVLTSGLSCDVREAASFLADRSREAKGSMGGSPLCLIAGGETTVRVNGRGLGGRNQELALTYALEMKGTDGVEMLSAGTDGTDGPTDAAGAMVDGETVKKAERAGLDAVAYLENNDSYNFFRELDSRTGAGHHLITGPTGTNVNDVQVILLSGARPRQ